ncbi:MAG: hypothetical protein A2W07_01025 [candidate division Zixibacteria bacterium RBG_16_43_9]|nr:MAG: hypothetical protein A2W07_01025 [candidate division Zixibacteria bacterium RBG_16_43_9]
MIASYRDEEIEVNKRTISPKTRLVLIRFNENLCRFTTWEDKDGATCDSLTWEDSLPIFGFNTNPL